MKLPITHILLGFYALLFIGINGYAQALSFQSYTTSQGLSQNSVYSIAETDDGFMWFGTQDGLNRFDGKNFVQITINKDNNKKQKEEVTGFSKMITALCADSNRLWVGTTSELLIYDRFTNRFIIPGASAKGFIIPVNIFVLKVEKDKEGNIWILTRNKGLYCYNNALQKMVNLGFKGENPNINSLSRDDNGQLWACSETEIYKRNNSGIFEAIAVENKLNSSGFNIAEMKAIKNRLWIITNSGKIQLLSYAKDKKLISTPFEQEFKGQKFLTDARLLYQSDSNTVWIGSRSEGLIKVNLIANTFENTESYQNEYSLRRQFILSIFSSSQNIIWIGTSGGGISKYDAARPKFDLWRSDFFRGNSSSNDNMILSIFSDNGKDFYMGTLVNGLLHFNEEKSIWNYYLPGELNKSPASKNIYTIAPGENNTLWLATWGGLYQFNRQSHDFKLYTNPQDEQTIELTTVAKLQLENKLLVGGYLGSLRVFNLQKKEFELPKDPQHILDSIKLRVRYMKEMQQADIFMGTESKGLLKYNYQTGLFTFFPQFNKASNDCRYFCFSSKNLWIATTDGLIQANSATMTIKKLWTIKDGLPNNYIYAVETDNNGIVWISSNAGICSINTVTGVCQKYKEENGLQGMEYNTAAAIKTNDNNIWFGGINGLNRINTLPAKVSGVIPPEPLLTNIKVMNAPYISDTATPYLHSIELPYNKNFISFEFQAPVFSQTENVIYEYKLIGVDSGWVNIGSRNFANYTQLKPGHYNFLIRCANAEITWSKNISNLAITIIPPWYATMWFRFITFLSVVTIVAFAIRQRIKNIQYKALAKQRIAEIEMEALKAQLNPHFIFNCISCIDGLIQNNEKYNATNYLNKFAKLMRNVLEGSKENTVVFSKDIETLKLYIDLEQLRNGDKYLTQLTIPDELMNSNYVVPPLIVQPFVENAIQHGLKNKIGNDGILQIKISREEDHLIYVISDNGVGRAATENNVMHQYKSYGVDMSKDRIKLFNNEEFPSVKIIDEMKDGLPSGTTVIVKIKLK